MTKKIPDNIGEWGVLPTWILCHPELPAAAKLLVVALSLCNKGKGIFPSAAYLERLLGMSSSAKGRGIRKHMRKLEALGIVEIVESYDKRGRQTSHRYKVDMTEPSQRIQRPPFPKGGSIRKWKKTLGS